MIGNSTRALRDWLEGRKAATRTGRIPNPGRPATRRWSTPGRAGRAAKQRSAALGAAFEGVPADAAERNTEQQPRWLLPLLDWHRREAKSEYWEYTARFPVRMRNSSMNARVLLVFRLFERLGVQLKIQRIAIR